MGGILLKIRSVTTVFGQPNRRIIKDSFNMNMINIDDVEEFYKSWLKNDIFVWFLKDNSLFNMKSRKRGNDVYAKYIYSKMMKIKDAFLSFSGGYYKKTTNVLTLSLTLSRKLDIQDAWIELGKMYSNFIVKVRKKFGKMSIVRCWEGHRDGYPHIHVMILFKEYIFNIRPYINKKGNMVYLIERDFVDIFRRKWNLGFINVNGQVDIKNGISYIMKYIIKQVYNDNKSMRSLALMWVYSKRCYSVSRDISDLIRNVRINSYGSETKLFGIADVNGFFMVEKCAFEYLKGKKTFEDLFIDNWCKSLIYRITKLV